MPDLIDELFDPEFYPGSRRKRHAAPIDKEPDPWRDRYTVKHLNGREVRLYPIGCLAEALGVSVPTIRFWVKKGHIPAAPYRLPAEMKVAGEKVAGRNLYTEEVIDATVDLLSRQGLLGKPITWRYHIDLPDQIARAWRRAIQDSGINLNTPNNYADHDSRISYNNSNDR